MAAPQPIGTGGMPPNTTAPTAAKRAADEILAEGKLSRLNKCCYIGSGRHSENKNKLVAGYLEDCILFLNPLTFLGLIQL